MGIFLDFFSEKATRVSLGNYLEELSGNFLDVLPENPLGVTSVYSGKLPGFLIRIPSEITSENLPEVSSEYPSEVPTLNQLIPGLTQVLLEYFLENFANWNKYTEGFLKCS